MLYTRTGYCLTSTESFNSTVGPKIFHGFCRKIPDGVLEIMVLIRAKFKGIPR